MQLQIQLAIQNKMQLQKVKNNVVDDKKLTFMYNATNKYAGFLANNCM